VIEEPKPKQPKRRVKPWAGMQVKEKARIAAGFLFLPTAVSV
jgi:hypothetical protein